MRPFPSYGIAVLVTSVACSSGNEESDTSSTDSVPDTPIGTKAPNELGDDASKDAAPNASSESSASNSDGPDSDNPTQANTSPTDPLDDGAPNRNSADDSSDDGQSAHTNTQDAAPRTETTPDSTDGGMEAGTDRSDGAPTAMQPCTAPISSPPCEDGVPPTFTCRVSQEGEAIYEFGTCPEWSCPGLTTLDSVVADGMELSDVWMVDDRSVSDTGAVILRFEANQAQRPEGGPFLITLSVYPGDGGPREVAAASDQIGFSWNNENCTANELQGSVTIVHAAPNGTSQRHVCGTFELSCTDPDSGASLALTGRFDSVATDVEPVPGR